MMACIQCKATSSFKVIRQRPLDRVELACKVFARCLAVGGRAFSGDPLLGVCDLRLSLAECIGITRPLHGAGGNRQLQPRASLVAIEIGFENMALELGFRVKECRIGCHMAAGRGFGTTAQPVRFRAYPQEIFSEKMMS